MTLEFFERRKGRWLLPGETVNWEVWQLELTVSEPQSEQGRGGRGDGERGRKITYFVYRMADSSTEVVGQA